MEQTNETIASLNQAEANRPLSSCIDRLPHPNDNCLVELAYERREVSENLAKLEAAIEADPAAVSDYHKDLWRKQAEAMRAYKEVLGERIKDLIDNE